MEVLGFVFTLREDTDNLEVCLMQEFSQMYFLFGSLISHSVEVSPERGTFIPQEPFEFKWLAFPEVTI